MKILCIYNSRAGGGKSKQYLDNIKQLFDKYSIDADIKFPTNIEHSKTIIQEGNLKTYDGLVVAGGDGSFFNVLNAYKKKKEVIDIPLGILPIGTGNSLSRDILDSTSNLEEYVKLISTRSTRLFDLAKVKAENETFCFANMMGFGFITDVSHTASKLKMFKKFSYTLGVLYNTIKLNTFELKITIDGKQQIMNNVFVIISNSKYTGGDYLIAPHAEIDDGKLDLIIVNKLSRINLLKTFPKIYDGSHVETEFVEYIQAKEIKLETNIPKILSPDGEVYGQFPISVSCAPKAIRIFSK